MNPAEQKLADMTREELLAEAEQLRKRLQLLDYRGCYWDANIVQKLSVAVDADQGVTMLREANAAFGNYTGAEPAVPVIGQEGRDFLALYAEGLGSLAANIKAAAAKFKGEGKEMEALLLIRLQLSVEETGEFAEALAEGDLVHAAKELIDISYVTDGHYLTLGLGDLKLPLYREVHSSNMSKLDPVTGKPTISDAGRWVKGPGYREAQLGPIVAGA